MLETAQVEIGMAAPLLAPEVEMLHPVLLKLTDCASPPGPGRIEAVLAIDPPEGTALVLREASPPAAVGDALEGRAALALDMAEPGTVEPLEAAVDLGFLIGGGELYALADGATELAYLPGDVSATSGRFGAFDPDEQTPRTSRKGSELRFHKR